MPEILFLHGGPGLTAELERRQFGTTLPVHWWDQPRISDRSEQAFEALVDAAVAELERLSHRPHDRVSLLASCFGALLARALFDRMPERVGEITISGGIWDLRVGILRIGEWLAHRHDDAELEAQCRETAEQDSPEGYLSLLARVSATRGFLDSQWSPEAHALRNAMRALASTGRLVDWPTLQVVTMAALTCAPPLPLVRPHPRTVHILIGRFDPYFHESDIDAWGRLWPTAIVQVVDAGHFPHLELPPSAWMPQQQA